VDTHPDIRSQMAGLRGEELRREAAEARLARSVQRDRRDEAGPDEVLLAGRSFRILWRRRPSTVPKPQV